MRWRSAWDSTSTVHEMAKNLRGWGDVSAPPRWRRWRVPALVLAGGLTLSVAGAGYAERQGRQRDAQAFESLADGIDQQIRERLGRSAEVLFGLRGLFAAEPVNRAHFAAYVASEGIIDRLPGLQAVDFAPPVNPGHVAAYETAVRRDTSLSAPAYARFQVHPPAGGQVTYPIQYVAPLAGNEAALGFDLGSEPMRRAALEEARDTGDTVATAPIELVQLAGTPTQRRGVLVFLALYDPTQQLNTGPERRRAFAGVVLTVLRTQDLLGALTGARPVVNFEVYDIGRTIDGPATEVAGAELFSSDGRFLAAHPERVRGPHQFGDVDAGGRRWRLFARVGPAFASSPSRTWRLIVLLVGSSVSALATWPVLLVGNARHRRRAEMLGSFLALTPDAVVITDEDGLIRRTNYRFEELFGYPAHEVAGAPVEILLPESLRAVHATHRDRYRQAPVVRAMGQGLELVGRRRDGSEFPVDVALAPLRLEEGTTLLAAAIRDATPAKAAEAALEAALEQQRVAAERLRETDRLKDEFLHTTAHELRTPLAALSGFLELLQDPAGMEEATRQELLSRAAANTGHMVEMVEQLLDLSLLQAGKVDLELRPLLLSEEVAAQLQRLAPRFRYHRLTYEVPNGLMVTADRAALGKVLHHLLSNATRFAPPGTQVTIAGAAAGHEVTVSVSDAGPGIPPADLPYIFDRFYQAAYPPPGTRGTGTGLAIVAGYVALMNGRVGASSEPGQGATISFTLPRVRPATATEGSAAPRGTNR